MGENEMTKKCLAILEVSQKQAFIFASNKLNDNITNSAIIAWVTSSDFFKSVAGTGYSEEENLIYSGGGHTILEFSSKENAINFTKLVTNEVYRQYVGLELFVKLYETKEKPCADDISKLLMELEAKKSIRRASFSKGYFGIEQIDSNTLDPILLTIDGRPFEKKKPDAEEQLDKMLSPDGFHRAFEFGKLGGSKGKSNFISVVHIDGNAMGKRVEGIRISYGENDWDDYKGILKKFSESVNADFMTSYKEMCEDVALLINNEKLENLSLQADQNGMRYFPIRRIITAGDDICFVTEGRIGIECARIFLEKLSAKKNKVDKCGYSACAGIAIVHQKYPFYKAYELAEMLCSNAKGYLATLGDQAGFDATTNCSAIDWHIEYGEIKDTLKETREMYETMDGNRMELRPYIICSNVDLPDDEKVRSYGNYRSLMKNLQSKKIGYANSKLKQLRSSIREGEEVTKLYMKSNLIDELSLLGYQDIFIEMQVDDIGKGRGLERKAFVKTFDGRKRSIFFDAIEMLDSYIVLGKEGDE
ncbi:MAG: hypothetical protein GX915_10050 [Clostridiales bacterium]|nr:hypothetical protein [Clostridiales bacterium]